MFELFSSSYNADPCIVRDRLVFTSAGGFSPQYPVVFVRVPDVRRGDILQVHGLVMCDNRMTVGGQLITCFVARRLYLESPSGNLWAKVNPDIAGGDRLIGVPFPRNMDGTVMGVYADMSVMGAVEVDRDYGDRFVVARCTVSSTRATPHQSFVPVLARNAGSNETILQVVRYRSDESRWREIERRLDALESQTGRIG